MQTAACTNLTFSLKHRVLYTPVFFFSANGVQMCSMSMHSDLGSSTSIFVASSILLQAKLILQWTVCLNIWCVGARWTSPLSKFTGRPPRNNLPLATCGCTFSNPGLHIKVVHNLASWTWLPEKNKMHFGRVTGQVKPQAKQVQTHHISSCLILPHILAARFFWLFVFVVWVTGPSFWLLIGCASDCLPGPSFLPKAMTGWWVLGAELLKSCFWGVDEVDEIAKGRQWMYMIKVDIHQPIW